ncbi:MAG: histidinol dehydrogenase [Deltaproteobacteria bacterium]|nr:histidinol dehydrogenase [Deltaproteobacteria bacterium]
MRTLNTSDAKFATALSWIADRIQLTGGDRELEVRAIIDDVRKRGDRALAAFTRRLDGITIPAHEPWLPPAAFTRARALVGHQALRDLELARNRIRKFHARDRPSGFAMTSGAGVRLAKRCHPLARVGVYVPGGRGAYPSTVLMNCIPARVAGVEEIVLATPPSRRGDPGLRGLDPHVVVAAELAGVTRILTAGGAQAIAALALGTATIPRVDKIVGPGNAWVATAKRLVYGLVDIDSFAGPSEVLVIADGSVPAAWTAADLLSQAEHDPDAIVFLVTTSIASARAVVDALEHQLADLPNRSIAEESLRSNGTTIVARDLDEAVDIANRIAPEHLEVHTRRARNVSRRLTTAGAVFVGAHTPEAIGDYLAGPNHVLPTGGTARFFSPLSTDDFVRRSNTLEVSAAALRRLGPPTVRLARIERFEAHARSVTVRIGEPRS